jgi:hypothetical protein
MKTYTITMRNSTVTQTHFLMTRNAKTARKVIAKIYADTAGWSIYRMWRVA